MSEASDISTARLDIPPRDPAPLNPLGPIRDPKVTEIYMGIPAD